MRIFLYIIACEALVHLWFNAQPLQYIRELSIRYLPLYVRGEHLFECKYCTSVWIGALLVVAYQYSIMDYLIYALVFHRGSNFLHLVFSYIRDLQFDLRIKRGR